MANILDKAIKMMDTSIEKEIGKYINEMAKIISPRFMTEQNIKDGIKKVDKLAKEIGKTLEGMKRRGEISSDGYAYYASKVDSVLKNANKRLYERLHETKDENLTKDDVATTAVINKGQPSQFYVLKWEKENQVFSKAPKFKTIESAEKWCKRNGYPFEKPTRDAQSVMDKAIRMMDSVKVFNTEKEAKEYIQKLNKEQNRKNIFSNIELRKENGKFKVIDKASDAVKGYGSFFQPSDFSKTSKKDLLDAYKKAREEYLKDIKNQTKFRAFKDAERACKMYGIRV